MAISPLAVANFFVGKSLATGVELTPMKVIKMVYIAHGWNLALREEPLLTEAVQAWKYGPVIQSVYHSFSKYKSGQITEMIQTVVPLDGGGYQMITPTVLDANDMLLLDSVWNAYSKLSGWQLSAITHESDTPWRTTWDDNGGGDKIGAIIPNDEIRKHYKLLAEKRKAK